MPPSQQRFPHAPEHTPGPVPARIVRVRTPRSRPVAVVAVVVTALVALLLTGVGTMSAAAQRGGVSFWSDQDEPGSPADSESNNVELGLKFTTARSGSVTAVRFYKFASDTGDHTGSVWDADGRLLARGDFADESRDGWQQLDLDSPVALDAGGVYTVSYSSSGHYADDTGFFTGSDTVSSGPLTALGGVYAYGSGRFPTSTWQASNYYADVVFRRAGNDGPPSPTSTTTAPTSSTSSTSTSSTSSTTSASSTTTDSPTSTEPPSTTTTRSPTSTTSTTTSPTSTTSTTTTSSPTTSTTSAGPGSFPGIACGLNPGRCGYPDASSTGPAVGVVLRRVPGEVTSGPGWSWSGSSGCVEVRQVGAVVSGLFVDGCVEVFADGVTVSDSVVSASGNWWGIGVRADDTTISRVRVQVPSGRPRLEAGIKDVTGEVRGTAISRVDVSGTSTAIQVQQGVVVDSFVHDLALLPGDHVNGICSNGSGVPLTIRHNTVLNQFDQTDAIALFQDFGVEANRVVDGNLIGGGSYTLYAGGGGRGTSSNIQVTNNRFVTTFFGTGGTFGPVSAWQSQGRGNVWSNNVWDHDSSAATVPPGS